MDDDLAPLFELFEGTPRQGPGSEATTRRALASLPADLRLERVLDLGCGSGGSTLVLAAETGAQVRAVDIHPPFLASLRAEAAARGLGARIQTLSGDMADVSVLGGGYDLLWSEGSAYTIGFERALRLWQPLLRAQGCLVVSQLAWFTAEPSDEAREYFASDYPQMQHESDCIARAREAGYELLSSFRLPGSDWTAYYDGVRPALEAALARHGEREVYSALRREEAVYVQHGHEYGYVCLTLRVLSP